MTTMDRSQLLRGVLDAAVLAIVKRQDGYGYDVVRRLRAAGLPTSATRPCTARCGACTAAAR